MRIHGRRGRVYLAIASGGTAEPVAFQNTWELSAATDKADVTAFGDGNKVYVAGLPDASGSFNGFYDTETQQTYTAALDGQPRKFYLYPDLSDAGEYWFGTVLPDFSASGSVDGPVTAGSSWNAASLIQKVSS